ncbi:ISNCY family transposase [Caldibacillus debilis]|uniref:ISNCY family transposase n=1 Tax=Caldibacillus debilis TaxID=301148 RepID=UPI00039B7701|nr:ISNCY family transposase [Caldibacillus debilis]
MTRKELWRYNVMLKHIHGLMTVRETANELGLSTRQVFRLKKRILEEGETGIIHKNRGRKPAHALSNEVREYIRNLLTSERYRNCNDHHLAELLAQHEGIHISPSTVRRIRCESNLPPKRKRRPPKAHRPRPRKPQAGMLVQVDASFHPWLEDRAKPFALLAAIDDATGEIVAAVFRPQEDTEGYLLLLKQMIEQKGIPMSIYSDRHTIFRSPKEATLSIEQELAGEAPPLSQFGQVLQELGITHIKALSPQAKGRIERLFETLQDRCVVELRLRNVNTIEEANQVLPELIRKHNHLFAVQPADPESAFVPLAEEQSLDHILCYREKRTVGSGETVSYGGKTYKIVTKNSKQTIPVKTRVEVRETLNGDRFIWYKGEKYLLEEVQKPDRQESSQKEKAGIVRTPHKPAANHPWRKPFLPKPRIPQRAEFGYNGLREPTPIPFTP